MKMLASPYSSHIDMYDTPKQGAVSTTSLLSSISNLDLNTPVYKRTQQHAQGSLHNITSPNKSSIHDMIGTTEANNSPLLATNGVHSASMKQITQSMETLQGYIQRKSLLPQNTTFTTPGYEWAELALVISHAGMLESPIYVLGVDTLEAATGTLALANSIELLDRSLGTEWGSLGTWRYSHLYERLYLDNFVSSLPSSVHLTSFTPHPV